MVRCPVCGGELEAVGELTSCPSCGAPLRVILQEDIPSVEVAVEADLEGWEGTERDILEFEEEELEELWGDIEES